jgi:putative ABC transport system ATP-binding protein
MIALKNIVKRYRRGKQDVEVLHGLNLEVPEGLMLALMGPSGSGKSTLLNLIGGLDVPTEGSVIVGGERVDQLTGSRLTQWRARHVGFVFQFYNLMPTLSARQNIELPLLLTSLSRAERTKHVDAAMDLVGLSGRASHRPSELSGGQQQRVAIARAIVADPTFLLCDEPTGDLDRPSAIEILNLLKSLNLEHGKTIIIVTHDQMAADCATRQLHVDKGRLTEVELRSVA